jgi:hypothetical protein
MENESYFKDQDIYVVRLSKRNFNERQLEKKELARELEMLFL